MQHILHYRDAIADDIPQLMELGVLAYGIFSERLGADKWALMRGNLSKDETYIALLQKAKSLVCTAGTQVVGMAYLMPHGNPTHIYPADWAYIRLVAVHPDYRGCGIAKRLTRQCIDHARVTGEKTIGLHTSEMMDAARHIYESMGFKRMKEIDNPFGVVYWLYRLEL